MTVLGGSSGFPHGEMLFLSTHSWFRVEISSASSGDISNVFCMWCKTAAPVQCMRQLFPQLLYFHSVVFRCRCNHFLGMREEEKSTFFFVCETSTQMFMKGHQLAVHCSCPPMFFVFNKSMSCSRALCPTHKESRQEQRGIDFMVWIFYFLLTITVINLVCFHWCLSFA